MQVVKQNEIGWVRNDTPPLSLLLHEVVEVVGAAAAAGCDGRRCGRGLPAGVGTEMGERPHRRGLYSLGHLARMLQYLSD